MATDRFSEHYHTALHTPPTPPTKRAPQNLDYLPLNQHLRYHPTPTPHLLPSMPLSFPPTPLPPPEIIRHNHHSFTHEELILLCAFKQLLKIPPKSPTYTPLDDDTIAEILKYARGCYDPLSIAGLYERVMDPEQDARARVVGELGRRSAYWFERVTGLYWGWMGGMRGLCERKLAEGTLDPYGRVPGSGNVTVLWHP